DVEWGGDGDDVEQAVVAFAAFDRSDVGAVQAGLVGQCFLRQPYRAACCTQACTELGQHRRAVIHGPNTWRPMPLGLQTISSILGGVADHGQGGVLVGKGSRNRAAKSQKRAGVREKKRAQSVLAKYGADEKVKVPIWD